jgi:hypothetical protein
MRLCKDANRRFDADAGPSTPALVPTPGAAATPPQRLPASPDAVASLSQSLKRSLSVEQLPLGLEQPLMLIDLDSFVDAVSAVVQESDPLPGQAFSIDEEASARLAAAPAHGMASAARKKQGTGLMLKTVSAALLLAAAASIASSARQRQLGR